MDFFSWQLLLALFGIYLLIRLYRFRNYLKDYVILYELQVTHDEIVNHVQQLMFTVKFGIRFFKRKYFWTVGEMQNANPLTIEDLKKLLSLTKRATFERINTPTEQDYYFIPPSNPNGTRDFTIRFTKLKENQ